MNPIIFRFFHKNPVSFGEKTTVSDIYQWFTVGFYTILILLCFELAKSISFCLFLAAG
jgi:hypothetical protein